MSVLGEAGHFLPRKPFHVTSATKNPTHTAMAIEMIMSLLSSNIWFDLRVVRHLAELPAGVHVGQLGPGRIRAGLTLLRYGRVTSASVLPRLLPLDQF